MKYPQDYDFIVIGSGFGGSVSACRLSEKGYTVAVLEMGKRWKSEDFPNTNWNLKRYFWAPLFRCFGFFRLSLFRHAWVLSGVGVGGGSDFRPCESPANNRRVSVIHERRGIEEPVVEG